MRSLANLLENVGKYAPADATVEIAAEVVGPHARITVRDHGPVITPGQEDSIFEKFTRGNTESAQPGMGWVWRSAAPSSTPTAGASGPSRQILPGLAVRYSDSRCRWARRRCCWRTRTTPPTPTSPKPYPLMSTPLPMALVLEDEREIRHFVRLSLQAEGWQVCEAKTIRQALVEARTRRPELVVADMGLPDGDGIDFIRQLRSGSGVLTIVLSARSHEQDKVHALDAGADDFITKPFGTAELLARTRANMRRVRAGRLDAAAVGAPAVMAFIKSGKLRCIATGSAQRSASPSCLMCRRLPSRASPASR